MLLTAFATYQLQLQIMISIAIWFLGKTLCKVTKSGCAQTGKTTARLTMHQRTCIYAIIQHGLCTSGCVSARHYNRHPRIQADHQFNTQRHSRHPSNKTNVGELCRQHRKASNTTWASEVDEFKWEYRTQLGQVNFKLQKQKNRNSWIRLTWH